MSRLALIAGALLQLGSGWCIHRGAGDVSILLLQLGGAVTWGWGTRFFPFVATPSARCLAGVMALVIPVFGWLVSAAFTSLMWMKMPRTRGRSLLVWSDRNLRMETDLQTVPGSQESIAEILRGPHIQARRNAILAVKDLDPSSALPLLRKGLQDSDEQVRIFAQNSLSTLMEGFEAGIKQLERRLAEAPTELATVVGLAEQYFELVYLDVAGDEETSAHLLGKAADLLARAAAQAPDDRRICLLRLRYALRRRDVAMAGTLLAQIDQDPADEQMLLPWRAELAFQMRDWSGVRRILKRFAEAGYVNTRIEALARFWRVKERA
ncbi:HEAT repeat domain-containing protein [Synoicihabitans lomoniglobus]|uniref:HEAT repeat domain-containing protein n=1 Tax=Synoicihabitans lomoniglobus TaxID=2909285 RepID=A0AAF0CQG7_9BACT|nr:HEAT repeat domain-containing protein [Opitutaceae bacterium LMO-M01]WED66126.1 HEAT repeat domain-containing protein [Opitutaceae bacterium LMO-M01]